MRVPSPPAITTAASVESVTVSGTSGWGARIRTWDHGTKTRCLTTWPRPTARADILAAVAEQEDEGDDGEDDERDDRERGQHERERRHEDDRQLRDGEDPRPSAHLLPGAARPQLT